jgi:hypothetical protein
LLRGSGRPGDTDNLGNLAKNDPAAYRLLRVAAKSYGLISPNVQIEPLPVQVEAVDQSVPVGRTLEEGLNLPEGYRCENQTRLNELIAVHRQITEMKARKAEEQRLAANAAAFDSEAA